MLRLGSHSSHFSNYFHRARGLGLPRVGRHVASVAALVLVATLAPGSAWATRSAAPAASAPDGSEVVLGDVGGGLRTAEVPLPLTGRGGPGAVVTSRAGFTMVAATWQGASETGVRVRVRSEGRWGSWRRLETLHDGPTPGTNEARSERHGTDLTWLGEAADAVRLAPVGEVPLDLRVVLVDSRGVRTDLPVTDSGARAAAAQRRAAGPRKAVARPKLRSRASWGAKERWRSGSPVRSRTIRQVHIHHTAGSNKYGRQDVPGIIAGIYRYHAKSLGWSDIGYNVLVDRFGRAWVGRHGGVGRRVRGAHTLGFNHNSTGIAVIGNFERRAPSRKVQRKIARVAAWQLHRNGRSAKGRIAVTSRGSDLYPAKTRVRLPQIDAHSHTNQTACPGEKLRAALPTIRTIAQRRIDRR